MKNIMFKLTMAVVLLGVTFSGCEEYFDINENPNRSTSAEPAFLFTAAVTGYSNTRAIEISPSAGSWSQIWAPGTFGVFVNPGRYVISPFTNGNTWRTVYTGLLKNLDQAVRTARRADVPDPNAIGQCKIMSAHGYWYATSLWGDIPFTEAINEDITQPSFDPQEVVLNGVIGLLDEAIDSIDVDAPLGIGAPNDQIFGGNMTAWVRFANSLRFRTLLMMADADPSKGDELVGMLNSADMISSAADNAIFEFYNEPIQQNPIWRILDTYTGQDNIVYFGSEATILPMQDLNDPRLDIFFTPGPGADGELIPNEAGSAGSIPNNARFTWSNNGGSPSNGIIRPDQPDTYFTVAEQFLLEAEAYLRFAGNVAMADAKYRDGIRASCTHYEVPAADIDTYLASLPDLATLSTEEAAEAIHIQQWIEYIERPLEAWTNWRRTEVPELDLPINAPTADIIRRLQYPPLEATSNTNTPSQKLLDEKMWFDQ